MFIINNDFIYSSLNTLYILCYPRLSIIHVPPSPPLPPDNRQFTIVRIFCFLCRGGRVKNYGVNGKQLFAIFSSTAVPTLHNDISNPSRLSSVDLCDTGNYILVRCVRQDLRLGFDSCWSPVGFALKLFKVKHREVIHRDMLASTNSLSVRVKY